jgi:hypothetical protein
MPPTLQECFVDFLRVRGVSIQDFQRVAPGLSANFAKVTSKIEKTLLEKMGTRSILPPGNKQEVRVEEPKKSVTKPELGDYLTADQMAEIQHAIKSKTHLGIWCDTSGMSPIVGTRYTKQAGADTYDVCEAVFMKLNPDEQAEYTAVEIPDVKIMVKFVTEHDGSGYLIPAVSEHGHDLEQAPALTADQTSAIEHAIKTKTHLGIWCDASGLSPIVGTRYTKQAGADTYDVCEAVFMKLNPDEQAEYTAVEIPDMKVMVKFVTKQSVPKTSPTGNPLVGFCTQHAGFRCDECDATLAKGATAFGSRPDDYDLCENCFQVPAPALPAAPKEAVVQVLQQQEFDAEFYELRLALGGCGLTTDQIAEIQHAIKTKTHLGIWCDASGLSPIVGTRYTKQAGADTYDVCEAVFMKLNPDEQAEYTAVEIPDMKIMVKHLQATAERSQELSHAVLLEAKKGAFVSRESFGAMMNGALARGFVAALTAEYVHGVEAGVGKYLDQIDLAESAQDVLAPLEELVRASSDPALVIEQIATKLGVQDMADRPAGAGEAPAAEPTPAGVVVVEDRVGAALEGFVDVPGEQGTQGRQEEHFVEVAPAEERSSDGAMSQLAAMGFDVQAEGVANALRANDGDVRATVLQLLGD